MSRRRNLLLVALAAGVTFGAAPQRDEVAGAFARFWSARDADARSDVWSLGIITYRLIGGKPPFTGNSFGDLIQNITHAPIPNLRDLRPDIPAGLEHVVLRCLDRDRTRRPDVVVPNTGSVAFSLPFGGFDVVVVLDAPPSAYESFEIDLDRDGLLDVITAEPGGYHVVRQAGPRDFGEPPRLEFPGETIADVRIADVAGDPRPEAVVLLWHLNWFLPGAIGVVRLDVVTTMGSVRRPVAPVPSSFKVNR